MNEDRSNADSTSGHRQTPARFAEPTKYQAQRIVPKHLMPRPAKPTAKPRRVYDGVKTESRDSPHLKAWAAQRLLRVAEERAPGEQFAEGLEYARLGQARTHDVLAGEITARIQGRMPKAYSVAIRCSTFQPHDWEAVLDDMSAQAKYAAGLLSGDLPANIEDLFRPRGLRLFPTEPADLALSCECAIFTGRLTDPLTGAALPTRAVAIPWCKHICCTLTLLAERLGKDPLLIFHLRGLKQEDLLDGLRKRRSGATGAANAGSGAARTTASGGGLARGLDSQPVFMPHVPALSEAPFKPLEDCVDDFWMMPQSLDALDLPLEPPQVSHPLLRRLGASPFADAKFPLVGLLATCYDIAAAAARKSEEERR